MASITRFYALILSTVLLLSGVPGFFPDFPSFQVLVSFFELTLVHSVVHFVVGLLGLMITALASDQSVRIYTIGISVLYGALMVVGLIGVNFSPILVFNSADNWLHGSIFVLSLGVFLAGIAEDRLGQRKAYLEEGLPQAQWAAPSDRARITAAAPPQARGVWQANMDAPPSAQGSWYNQPQYDQPTPSPWGPGSRQQQQWQQQQWQQQQWQQQQWQQYEQPPSQPFNLPPDPSQDPSRDPWNRVERHAPYHQPQQPQPPSRPAGSPSWDQQSNPWSQNPSQPAPRPPSQWPPSQPQPQSQPQPPQGPSPWSPWPQDSQPRDGQRPSQAREQWPMDEWDSRPLQ